jgi:7-carboxy-7-deazaguanine synthase
MNINTQPPEPPVQSSGSKLDVHSLFLTIQGEGPFSGRRAVFVRLAGCNLQCPGCDTLYTDGRRQVWHETLAHKVGDLGNADGKGNAVVVITGGEPLRQPIGPFVELLVRNRHPWTVQIESNGTCEPDVLLQQLLMTRNPNVHLVVSPKTKKINPVCMELATAFKYVLDHRHVGEDGLPTVALEHERGGGVARPRLGAPVYITPYDAQDEDENALNNKAVVDSCLDHGHIAGLQIHKYLMVP